jgi:arylsulfatase A-like enzyme
MGLSHGGLRQKMFVAYEEVLRVPLIFSNPLLFAGSEHKNSMALASLVDIMPTILDIAGMEELPKNLNGTSLLPIMEDNTPVQQSVLFAFDDTKAGVSNKPSMVNAANRIRCIRTEEWKYAYYFHAMGKYYNQYELYNLLEDASEVNNLAYEEAYQEKRLELEAQLHKLEIEKLRAAPPEFILPRLLKK